MHIEHLSTANFRNLTRLELAVGLGPVVLRGPNGQGKTNILEAVFVCATGRSFRQADPADLLAFGSGRGRVAATFVRQSVRHEVAVLLEGSRRTVKVDDRGLKHVAALLELINVVAFFPEDLKIVKGAPEERRRFLDRAVANFNPGLVTASLAYLRALRSRNALLRDKRSPDVLVLEALNEQLISHGAVIQALRQQGLAELAPLAAVRFRAIMPDAPNLVLELKDGLGEQGGLDEYADRFRQRLAESFARDRARGMTCVGPHRADLVLMLADRDGRAFASQGQQRAMVLALKLAEVTLLTVRLNSPPILLLDDISSELDAEKTKFLLAEIEPLGCQAWISTTGAAPLDLPAMAQIFEVKNGTVKLFSPPKAGR